MDGLDELGLANISHLLKSGVYVLIYKGEVVYVGRSGIVIRRIADHINKIPFDTIHAGPCENSEEMEAFLIDKFKPRYNTIVPGPYHNPNKKGPGVVSPTWPRAKYNRIMGRIVRKAAYNEEPESVDDHIDEITRLMKE